MTALDDVIHYLDTHPSGKPMFVSTPTRNRLATQYVFAREMGANHRVAKKHALRSCSFSPVVAILVNIAFAVVWELLKRWWENRNAGHSS